MHSKILFVCTGNYYRSRFAEEYFNHLVETKGLSWQAYSKGLSPDMPNSKNPGPISLYTLKALENRKIKGRALMRFPEPIEENDFRIYDKIIALSELEHRPMLEARFREHCEKVGYFEVGDLPVETPDEAMNKLAILVEKLVEGIGPN